MIKKVTALRSWDARTRLHLQWGLAAVHIKQGAGVIEKARVDDVQLLRALRRSHLIGPPGVTLHGALHFPSQSLLCCHRNGLQSCKRTQTHSVNIKSCVLQRPMWLLCCRCPSRVRLHLWTPDGYYSGDLSKTPPPRPHTEELTLPL